MRSIRRKKKKGGKPPRLVIVAEARLMFEQSFPDVDLDGSGACLYWAMCAVEAARRHGLRLIINAGSASWRRLPIELDDGEPTTSTHFSYVWEGGQPFSAGDSIVLPEIHIWAADPKRGHIVDLSTRYLPTLCENTAGEDWLSPAPPGYFWGGPRDLPEGWFYEPARDATALAVGLMANERHKLR